MSEMNQSNGTLHRISETFASVLIRHRVLILLVSVLLTAFFGYRAAQLKLSAGFDKSIPLSHPYMKTFTEFRNIFGGANRVTIFVRDESGNMFNPEWFRTFEKVTADVLVMPGVDARTVTSIFTPNVNFVAVSEIGFTGSRIVPATFSPTPEGIEQVKSNLAKSTEIGKTVAKDLSGALVVADLIERDPTTGEEIDYGKFAKQLELLKTKYEKQGIKVHITGFAPFVGYVIDGVEGVVKFFGIAFVLTFVLLLFFSGSWKLALSSMVVSLAAVIWQLGAIQMLGYGLDPMSILVPFLILSIGVSHAVQMTNAWRMAVVDGETPQQAAHTAVYRLLVPGATAILVDAVGFAVIILIPVKLIGELGVSASIGVGIMLLTNKMMLPIFLSWTRLSSNELARAQKTKLSRDHSIWSWLAKVTNRKVAAFILVLAVVMGGVGYMAERRLVVGDTDAGSPEFWPGHIYNQDINTIVNRFSVGLDELVVVAQSDVTEACVDYGVMKTIDDFVWQMQNVPGVKSVVSLTEIVRERNIGNYEANPKFLGMPFNSQMISANMYRIEASQGMFSNDCKAMPIRLYLSDHKADTLHRITAAVDAFNKMHGNPHVNLRLAMGNGGIMAATNEEVAQAQLRINLTLFAAVGLFVFLTFLSWRATVCAMVPLILVAYFANVVMVGMNIGLKIFVLPVLALGVGVGVDYSIYLIARMLSHMNNRLSVKESYANALREVGVPVIFTSITMSVGVATWFWSSLKFQADMGILLAYMFFVNMLGAILLMPALATFILKPKK
ncbi:MAG: efflux RND transporter permease subunit [Rugosibacter sp.]|nr:efflux RND transporter permease subunit [Rugosibacter sp.]